MTRTKLPANDDQQDALIAFLLSVGSLAKRAEAAPKIVQGLDKLVSFLRAADEETWRAIFKEAPRKRAAGDERKQHAERVLALDDSAILGGLENASFSRAELELLATKRFAMTASGISNLKSRVALADKLVAMLRNELAHEVITRVVAGDPHGHVDVGSGK